VYGAPRPGVVLRFIEAFNAGNTQRLDRLFAPPGDFLWYAIEGYTHTDRTTLVRYLEQEHSGVELRLTRFRFTGYGDGYGHFEICLIRTTREGALNYHGKGAAICHPDDADVIAVWAMGRQSEPTTQRRAPNPALVRTVRSVHRQVALPRRATRAQAALLMAGQAGEQRQAHTRSRGGQAANWAAMQPRSPAVLSFEQPA
jgi:hypothetical protein